MKKILGIIVLGFFLSANLLADDYTISENSTSTNGENTIDGSDSLTLNSGITITTSGANEGRCLLPYFAQQFMTKKTFQH